MTTVRSLRAGFTMVELLVSLVVTAIVGASLIKLLMGQNRFMDQQEAARSARAVSRSSLNKLFSDLRVVEAVGGVEAAAAGGQDFTVRVPYAFGVMCSSNGTTTTVSLLPADSAMFWAPGFSGFAWRDQGTGAYTYVQAGATLNTAGTVANCTGAGVKTLSAQAGSPAGRVVNLGGTVNPIPLPGTVFFLYRRIRYEFKNSAILPGRVGLWRTYLSGGATEELAAPFDNTARVNFYVNNASVAQSAVPALNTIRGFELQMDGQSDLAPRGYTQPKAARVTTSVFFANRPD
jgi:prepilin-type N-terminal cleavage/methylation domain-containing protein